MTSQEEFDTLDDRQIDWIRDQIVDRGTWAGCLGGPYPVAYWSAEELFENFRTKFPDEFIPRFSN
jgi:hypothetical protein